MTPAKTPATVEVQVASMVCTTGVGGLLEDHEYFVPLPGRGQRRPVRPGDHLAVDHPLVVAYPDRFAPSPEPPDVMVVGVLTEEARVAKQAATIPTAPCNVRKVTPVCMRCGAESEHSVIVLDQPQATDLLSALSNLEDSDYVGRLQVEQKFAMMARAAKAQGDELLLAEQEWRTEHVACPDGTPLLPEPAVPESGPLVWRLPTFRTFG